jgi:hypothetical protein
MQFVTGQHNVKVMLFKPHVPATELLKGASLHFCTVCLKLRNYHANSFYLIHFCILVRTYQSGGYSLISESADKTYINYKAAVTRGTTVRSFKFPSSKTDWNVATGITDNDISDSRRGNYQRAQQGVLTNAFDLTCKNQRSSVACGPQTTFGPSKRPCVVALRLSCKKRTALGGFFIIFLSLTLQWPQPLIPHYTCYEMGVSC